MKNTNQPNPNFLCNVHKKTNSGNAIRKNVSKSAFLTLNTRIGCYSAQYRKYPPSGKCMTDRPAAARRRRTANFCQWECIVIFQEIQANTTLKVSPQQESFLLQNTCASCMNVCPLMFQWRPDGPDWLPSPWREKHGSREIFPRRTDLD